MSSIVFRVISLVERVFQKVMRSIVGEILQILKRGSGDHWKGSERVGNIKKERRMRVDSKTCDAICSERNKNM